MKVHIISELYYPEQNATGYFLTGIAECLVSQEQQVFVLCAQPSYNQRGEKADRKEVHNGVRIRRCWSTTFDPRRILGRLVNFITTSISIGWRTFWSIRPGDKVLVVTNPPLLPFLVRFACWLRKAKFVLLVHDVYPDVFVPLGLLSPSNPLFKILSSINGYLYAFADRVVVLGRDMGELVKNKSRGKAAVSIIPNWADIDGIRPAERKNNSLLLEHDLGDKFIIQYSGNHGRTHDLLSIVEAANYLREESEIHFLFVGEGSGKAIAVQRAAELELKNITFLTYVERSELNSLLNASDVAMVAFKSGMAGISVPSRLYNLMAAGRPVLSIVDQGSEVAQVICEAGVGVVVPPESPQKLAKEILRIRADAPGRIQMSRNARAEAVKKYSYSAVSNSYRELFDSLG